MYWTIFIPYCIQQQLHFLTNFWKLFFDPLSPFYNPPPPAIKKILAHSAVDIEYFSRPQTQGERNQTLGAAPFAPASCNSLENDLIGRSRIDFSHRLVPLSGIYTWSQFSKKKIEVGSLSYFNAGGVCSKTNTGHKLKDCGF